MAKLTEKQKKFADEYLINLNATQAAIKAGYSKKTADVQGVRLLGNVKVQEQIKKRQKELEHKTEITQERVLRELANVAFANTTDFVSIEGVEGKGLNGETCFSPVVKINLTKDVSPDKLAAIAAIKQGKEGIEIKTRDKVKALELLGKHLGMFTDADNDNDEDDGIKLEVDYGDG